MHNGTPRCWLSEHAEWYPLDITRALQNAQAKRWQDTVSAHSGRDTLVEETRGKRQVEDASRTSRTHY